MKRDRALRSVSRNLRFFGYAVAGERAARAMTDGGKQELPPPTPVSPVSPRPSWLFSCDGGLWREDDGTLAATPHAREEWAQRCLVKRDFDWIGLPKADLVREAAATVSPGEVKANLLAMLVNAYGDAETLQFVIRELRSHSGQLPNLAVQYLNAKLKAPIALYRLGNSKGALDAARSTKSFKEHEELVRALVVAGDVRTAITIFELLLRDPQPKMGSGNRCFDWFNMFLGFDISDLGNTRSPRPTVGEFFDAMTALPTFQEICPQGLDADTTTSYLLAAGRFDAAIDYVNKYQKSPFRKIRVLLRVGEVEAYSGNRVKALEHARAAASILPDFDPGDPYILPVYMGVVENAAAPAAVDIPPHNYGENGGDTLARLEVIRLLAAAGAPQEADRLARQQRAGALRAVALSVAVAGRIGFKFGPQEQTIDAIQASDL